MGIVLVRQKRTQDDGTVGGWFKKLEPERRNRAVGVLRKGPIIPPVELDNLRAHTPGAWVDVPSFSCSLATHWSNSAGPLADLASIRYYETTEPLLAIVCWVLLGATIIAYGVVRLAPSVRALCRVPRRRHLMRRLGLTVVVDQPRTAVHPLH
jgi:hypothetical protein